MKKVSIITASLPNRKNRLTELYESIIGSGVKDWEWIIWVKYCSPPTFKK